MNNSPATASIERRPPDVRVALCAGLIAFVIAEPAVAASKNGFDISNATVSKREIMSGGVRRDGIPAIDEPKFVAAADVDYLRPDDLIIGLVKDGKARAYPTRILIWHEIVNDTFEDQAVAVTYCPLCGTGMVFARSFNGEERLFGVSGLLYRSDVLMYDRESESLWSQLAMEAVTGPALGTKLNWLASKQMTWQAWQKRYPHSEVLSTDTGYHRNYGGEAYADYFASDEVAFPVPRKRRELPQKSWVVGVIVEGEAKAYPIEQLPASGTIRDSLGDTTLELSYDAESRHAAVTRSDGEPIPAVVSFWFAWQAFYPATGLWTGTKD